MRQCPNCHSDDLIYQRRGSDVVNGYVASRAFGPMGWLAANAAADNIIATCPDCELQFEFAPQKRAETSIFLQLGQAIGKLIALVITLSVMGLVFKIIGFFIDLFN